MNTLPKAKLDNVVVQDLGAELLVYNLTTNQAFCLNDTLAKVFNACDGRVTFDELKAKHRLTDGIIYLALDKLKEQDLLEGEYVSPFAGISRREVILRVGLASMIALPVISSLVAPTSAHAVSGPGPTVCARMGGTCIPAGQNICTGAVGQTVTIYYDFNNIGACRGADYGSPGMPLKYYDSPDLTSSYDICRVPS